MRLRFIASGLLLISAAIVVNLVGLPIKTHYPSVTVTAPPLSPYFAEAEQRLGLTGTGKRTFELAAPSCSDKPLPNDEQGEYKAGKIIISKTRCESLGAESLSVIAHEYLHAVWATQTSLEQKAALSSDLRAFYDTHLQRVTPRFNYYRDQHYTDEQLSNEFHSVFGTEIVSSELSGRLQSWYHTWLPNRVALPDKCC